jgi:hypothetical protein
VKDASGKWVGWGLGDTDPKVTAIKAFLAKKFSYAAGLDTSPVYNTALQTVVMTMQTRYGLPATGIFDYATQIKCGFVKAAPKNKPLMFSVEGHMSDMFHGPVADTATALEGEGRLHHQPIGYQNGSIPFDNASGVTELARLVGATTMDTGIPFPKGTPWVLSGFSQGGIVITDFYLNHLLPGGDLNWRLPDLLGVLAYGNPCRETGSVAPWSRAQAGPAANAGIDPLVRFGINGYPQRPANWMDVYRKGDIFADNLPNIGLGTTTPTAAANPLGGVLGGLTGLLNGKTASTAASTPSLGQMGVDLSWLTQGVSALGSGSKSGDIDSAVYQAVARADLFSNPYSLVAQIADIFTSPVSEVMGIFQSIIGGIGFLANQNNPHYSPFDISGGVNWVRSILPQ